MNKKGMTKALEVVMDLFIIVVLTFVILSIATKFWRLSTQGAESFGRVVGDINAFAADDKTVSDSTLLQMDKGTSFYIFGKNSDAITYGNKAFFDVIPRPEACPDEVACAVLCRKKFNEEKPDNKLTGFQRIGNALPSKVLTCDKMQVLPLNETIEEVIGLGYWGSIFSIKLSRVKGRLIRFDLGGTIIHRLPVDTTNEVLGGVIFERGVLKTTEDPDDPGFAKKREKARDQVVYMQKVGTTGSTIAMCTQRNDEGLCYDKAAIEAYQSKERAFKNLELNLSEMVVNDIKLKKFNLEIPENRALIIFPELQTRSKGNCSSSFGDSQVIYDIFKPPICEGEACICLCNLGDQTSLKSCSEPNCIKFGGYNFVYNYDEPYDPLKLSPKEKECPNGLLINSQQILFEIFDPYGVIVLCPHSDNLLFPKHCEQASMRYKERFIDTDGDGYSNSDEVAAGSDSLDPDSIPSKNADVAFS